MMFGELMKYRFIPGGLSNELSILSNSEIINHLHNYIGNFILDPNTCAIYLNKFLSISKQHRAKNIDQWAHYLLKKYLKLLPMNDQALTLWSTFSGNSINYLHDVLRCRPPLEVQTQIENLTQSLNPELARRFACKK
jgi:hypothetical protein